MSDGKSLKHSLAGLSRWAGIDPDKRSEHMRMMRQALADKRAAEQAEREARGEVVAKPKRRDARRDDPMPPIGDLLPLMADIQRERADAGLAGLSEEALMREASLRIRRAIAKSTLEAMKAES